MGAGVDGKTGRHPADHWLFFWPPLQGLSGSNLSDPGRRRRSPCLGPSWIAPVGARMRVRVRRVFVGRMVVEAREQHESEWTMILMPNKRQALELEPDVLESVDPIFYGEVRQAAFKALGLT